MRTLLPIGLTLVSLCVSLPAFAQEEPALETPEKVTVVNEPLPIERVELLGIAFDAASAFPTVPHVKNRARAQFEVVEACFALGQPIWALEYSKRIDGWRKGAGFAEFAAYCAQRGENSERVQKALADAKAIANQNGDEEQDGQAWRRDLILVKVALAEYLLDNESQRGELAEAALSSGNATVALMLGTMSSEELLEREFEALAKTLEQNDFENSRDLLTILVDLFDRNYGDTEKRKLIEKRIRTSWGKLPLMIRMELLMGLARSATKHAEPTEFHRYRTEAFALFEDFNWMPETRVPLEAQWAELRFLAGEVEAAKTELEQAHKRFETNRDRIYDINRADALRPVAEAYHAIGLSEEAGKFYALVIEAGVENPNSRPRVDDLVATCCSIAKNGFEPNEELRKRIREIRSGLGSPW